MRIDKDNITTASPARVAEAHLNGTLDVPLNQMNVSTLLQLALTIGEMLGIRSTLRARVDVLEKTAEVHAALIQQLIAQQAAHHQ